MSNMKKEMANYAADINRASNDENIQKALGRAITSYRKNVTEALERYPHTLEMAEEVKAIKLKALDNWQPLMEEAMEAIRRNHGQAYFAKDGAACIQQIHDIIGPRREIVKGKSMLGEEIHLRQELAALGHEVWETDLGEFILQLINERPMHILSPAIHMPREQVAEVFSKFFGREIAPEVAEEVAAVREFLREKYFAADVGISGANAVAAETGQIAIIENEGNVRLCTGVPPIHIAVVGIEKLVPTFIDAMKVCEVNWRFGQYGAPGYLNVISGPSKTGDIEKVTTYGAHGPREFHVIFVDNGRSDMIADTRYKEAALCLRCGGCMYECPVFALTAGHFGHTYMGGIGGIWTAFVEKDKEEAVPVLYNCLRCGRCIERCPMKIDVPSMTAQLREDVMKKYE